MKRGPALAVAFVSTALVLGVAWSVSGGAVTVWGLPAPLVLGAGALLLQWLAFLPAFALKTETFYDLLGALTFLSLVGGAAWIACEQVGAYPARMVSALLVCVWAIRLGRYLFGRVKAVGHDVRFDEIKHNGPQFFMTWTLQGAWTFLTSLSVLVVITAQGEGPAIGPWSIVGWSLWLIGFAIEVIADRQKTAFRARQSGPRRWIDEGLWAYAQHPNYFGEMLLWLGLFIAGADVYQGVQWVTVISPLFVVFLLTQVSGIPMLKAQGKRRWGDDPAYQAYLDRTHLLIPWPSRRDSSAP